ncbi:MAG TPA: hypothetical protein VMW50_09350 [Dehalococcoidia bacterium]|nr:hypothetical protein [Dehalococcoidia bacterium]
MSFIKQMWICKVDETPGKPDTSLQKEQEMGFWRKVWEFIKLLFIWID